MFSRFTDDFDSMFMAIDSLDLITSPKIGNDDIKTKLEWLERNKDSWCVKDDVGCNIRENREHKNIIRKRFRECFKLILKRLDDQGILTRLKEDPATAMGKMDA